MPDTHLILHIKGTDSQTAALLREEVRSAVWQGKITQSQLIWRPTENAWKPVRELPDLIPPVEHLILHVKGTEAETRQLPRPAVREAISKGHITHSQLIWRPQENMWKQVREMPDLLPSQKLAPAPAPARVHAIPVARPVDEIIPESPTSPVARAVAASGAPPRVKLPVAVPHARAVATPEAVPKARVAVAAEEAPEPQPVATPQAVPKVRAVAPPAAVPRVRVAVAPEDAQQPRVVATPEVIAQVDAVATPEFVPQVRAVVTSQPVPQVRGVPVSEEIPQAVEISEPAPKVRAVVASMVPRARAVPEMMPDPHPEVASPAEADEMPEVIRQVRPMAVPTVPQARAVAVPHVRAVETSAELPHARPVVTSAAKPQVRVATAAHVGEKTGHASIAPAALIAEATTKSRRVKEEATAHPLKSLCIGLGLLLVFLIGANYFFVDRPLAAGIKASEFSGVSVYGHLAAFVQPNVIVIHVPPNKMIIEENFTKFLATLAHATPANPINSASFSRVALTSEWTAQYSFSGQDWKQLAQLGDETEASRKEFIMAHLEDAGGEPVMSESTLHDENRADKREAIWLKFVDTYAIKPPQ